MNELDRAVSAAFDAALVAMGESFTLSRHSGEHLGVFRGIDAETSYEIDGIDRTSGDAVSFRATPRPELQEILTRKDGTRWVITRVDPQEGGIYDCTLRKED